MTLCPEMQTETKPLPVRERPATLKQKAMVAPNKPFYWPVIIILAATAGLSALGLFFCWKSPIGECYTLAQTGSSNGNWCTS